MFRQFLNTSQLHADKSPDLFF